MENKQLQAIKDIAGIKISDIDFFDKLEIQNKEKTWQYNPIQISVEDGLLTHNAENVSEAVENLVAFIDEKIEESESVDEINGIKKQSSIIHAWISGTRQQLTKPFDDLKSSFTKSEKSLKDIDFKTKIDLLNEAVYRKRKSSIEKELQSLITESGFNIELITFKDFIDVKKKIKGFDVNKKDELSAAAKKTIKEQFDLVMKPMIEAKQIQENTTRENNQFATQMSHIKESDIESQLLKLEEMRNGLELNYTNIIDSAKAQINAEISIINIKIKTAKQEEERKKEANLDAPIMEAIRFINVESDDIAYLEETFSLASQDRDKLKNEALTVEANYILQRVQNRIAELKKQELLKQQQEDDRNRAMVDAQEQNIHEDIQSVDDGKYMLSREDIEFVGNFRVEAGSEEIAKNEMVEMFRLHIEMVELRKGNSNE